MIKRAFTLLELVIVIIVLGILASIGADIITSLYDNYLRTRAVNRLQIQSELVLDQIAKRLQYRIKSSTIARDDGNFADYRSLPLADENYEILEWIGKSNESFIVETNTSAIVQGWSGFIDVDSNETDKNISGSGNDLLKTLGSRLDLADIAIQTLSYNQVSLDGTTTNDAAIIFKGTDTYDLSQFGWNGVDGNYTHKVRRHNNDTLRFTEANSPNEIFEQYDLVTSAYAIAPVGSANDFNLTLYYNYQPWNDMNYTSGNSVTLMENVSTFRFSQIGDTIRVKICVHDNNQTAIDFDFAFCKERVIY